MTMKFEGITNRIRRHWGLFAILLLYLLLSFNYNAASPIFESPDESTHFRYVKYLRDHKHLPAIINGPNRDELWGLHQPPLYFMLSAILSTPFNLIHPDEYLARNPHVNLGAATLPGNKNVFIHTPAESFPWRGFPLTIRFLRLISTFFGALTLLVVYCIGLELFNGRQNVALLAPLLMTLHPEFVFINSAIHNEPLNIFLMSVGLWGSLRLIRDGASLKLAIAMGVVGGAIIITKMTGLVLLLIFPIAMLLAALRKHSAKQLWLFGVIVASLTAIIGGWWYLFNWRIYGDPFQSGMYRDFYGDIQRNISFKDWYGGILQGEVSFWATFGWFNILVPDWMYDFYKILLRAAGSGLLVFIAKRIITRSRKVKIDLTIDSSALIILGVVPIAGTMVLSRLIATEGGIQGRQLLPILPALALLMVFGLWHLFPKIFRKGMFLGVGILMLAFTAIIPARYIAPAYALPSRVAETELSTNIVPAHRIYGGQVELLGYTLSPQNPVAGDTLDVTLYWRTLHPVDKNYTVFVHTFGRAHKKIGAENSYAGQGNFPFTQWEPNVIYADLYQVQLNPTAKTPTLLTVDVGLFDDMRLDLPPLSVTDAEGQEMNATLFSVPLRAKSNPMPPENCQSAQVDFDDNIHLNCYFWKDGTLTLYWNATGTPSTDYQVFIQLWNTAEMLTGFDAPPLNGDYPTHWWAAGEKIVDAHAIIPMRDLPQGDYRLRVGLYRLDTGERLPAFVDGNPLPDFAFDISLPPNVPLE